MKREDIADGRRSEAGAALLVALFLIVSVVGVVAVGAIQAVAHRKKVETSHARYAHAVQMARSGLIEGLGWFRKQTAQPVLDFEPQLLPSAVPPILDTADPDIGIVREFQITGNIWGRYEVWKDWAGDPSAERLAWRTRVQVEEVSSAVGVSSGGSWVIRSIGHVFEQRDSSIAYNEWPNRLIATEPLEVQIRRLVFSAPGNGAINVQNGNNLTVNTQGRVFGGAGAGIFYPTGTGTPNSGPPGSNRITGTPSLAPTSGTYDDSLNAVFGVERTELLAMADDIVTDMAAFPVPVSKYTIVAVTGNAAVSFDAGTPLNSTGGIVYIEGNTTLLPGNLSSFSGMLYVDGNLTIREPCEIKGTIICTGNMTIQGASDFADVYFDEAILNDIRLNIGNYRFSNAIHRPDIR